MAASVRVRPEGTADGDGAVRLTAEAMERLDVAEGDTVAVTGSRRTVGRVVRGEGPALGERAARNAGTGTGTQVTVEPVTAPAAEAVHLDVSRSVRGAESFLRRRLERDPVLPGDTVEATFQGGTVRVTFTVRETRPAGPVVIAGGTDLDVEGPEADAPRLDTGTVGFDDVGGVPWLEEFRELVRMPFERGETFEALGGRPPGAVLVHGPAGSGKTLLAGAVANESPVEAVAVPATAFLDGPDGLRELADTVLDRSPAVLVLDDVDAVGRAAPTSGEGSSGDRATTVALWSLLDDLRRHPETLVVGTATDPDDLDPSLRRGGRFDREFELPVPDREGRLEILRALTAEAPAWNVDLGDLAGRTFGYVGADLRALVDEATLRAVRRTGRSDAGDAVLTTSDFEAALGTVEPGAMRSVSAEVPDVTFDDVGGLEAAKRELVRAVELPLRRPDLFEAAGVDPPRGVLLYGPPGTGKTLLARAVAGVTEANFIPVEGPELLDKYVGESERAVREVFRRAGRTAPAVVFFDEVDALAPERSEGGSGSRTTERVVSQLLTEIDGLEPRGEVAVIATTNRPELVDSALLRPGRLERVVPVSLPDADAREEILRVHTREVPLDGVDLSEVARETDGYSGSDLEAVVREASLLAIEERLRAERTDAERAADVRVTGEAFERALEAVGPSVSPEVREHHRGLRERFEGRSARRTGEGPTDPGTR
ncbi:AAA family ATPase [Halobacteriales archaeon QS_5_70_15]|nr:MAG: AAA family ATPase [Halobacteriales archaeon QS_5_70_15]